MALSMWSVLKNVYWVHACTHTYPSCVRACMHTYPRDLAPNSSRARRIPPKVQPSFRSLHGSHTAPPPTKTGARTAKVPLEMVRLSGPEPDFRGPNLRCTTNLAVWLQMSNVASPSLSFPVEESVTWHVGVSMLLCTLVITSLATPG